MQTRSLLAFGLGTIAGLLCLGVGLFGLYRDWQFSGNVERVSATIDHLQIGSGRSAYHLVFYHFDDSNGLSHSTKSQVGRKTWEMLYEGESVPVKYLAGSPQLSRIDLPAVDSWSWKNSLIGVFCGVMIFSLVFWVGWQGKARSRR